MKPSGDIRPTAVHLDVYTYAHEHVLHHLQQVVLLVFKVFSWRRCSPVSATDAKMSRQNKPSTHFKSSASLANKMLSLIR